MSVEAPRKVTPYKPKTPRAWDELYAYSEPTTEAAIAPPKGECKTPNGLVTIKAVKGKSEIVGVKTKME